MDNSHDSNKPVAWMTKDGEIYKHECWPEHEARPLVFGDTSPQRTWVGLTDVERRAVKNSVPYSQFMSAGEYAEHVQKATEFMLLEKNQ